MQHFRPEPELWRPQNGADRSVDWRRHETIARRVADYEERRRFGHVYGSPPRPGAIELFTNDYLRLTRHPQIVEAQIAALAAHGNGLMMSGVYLGEDGPQRRFERRMARLLKSDDVMVCQSGWSANAGLVQSMAGRETPVYLDTLAHMSLWEGAQSAGAKAVPFRHNDVGGLRRQIKKHGPGIIAVDSVYSINGSIAPLAEIAEIASRSGSLLIVDESHAIGVLGRGGRGLVAATAFAGAVAFRTASLSKAFAGRGGIIAGPARLIEFIRYESRPAIFSSALLPHDIAGFDAALDVITRSDRARARLCQGAAYLRAMLMDRGFNVADSASQILALEPGPEPLTFAFRDALEAEGVFGAAFVPPATPRSRTVLRLSLHCDLTRGDLDYVARATTAVGERFGFRDWPSTRRRPQTAAAA